MFSFCPRLVRQVIIVPVEHIVHCLLRIKEAYHRYGIGWTLRYPEICGKIRKDLKMMEDKFLPANLTGMPWGPGSRLCLGKKKPHNSNWMDPEGCVAAGYYPHALLSYYYWDSIAFELPGDGFIFGDSGGFSVMTLGANIDARDVMRWQLLVCDAGVLLDVPPIDKHGNVIWEEALNRTVQHTKVVLPQYLRAREEGSEFKWWGVVHGWTQRDLREWWQKINTVYPFMDVGEGWAFKPRPTINPVTVAENLRFIRSVKIKCAHFLMTTGVPSVTTLMCLGPRAGLEFLTYDSSSAFVSGVNRELYVPAVNGLGWVSLGEKFRESGGEDRKARDYVIEKCECASCQYVHTDEKQGWWENEEYWKFRFIYHNLLVQIKTFAVLREEAETDADALLREILGEKQYALTMHAFRSRTLMDLL